MEPQIIIDPHWREWLLFTVTLIVALIGYIARQTRSELDEVRKKVNHLCARVEAANTTERHVEQTITRMERLLETIDAKLDHKVNKNDCLRLHPYPSNNQQN